MVYIPASRFIPSAPHVASKSDTLNRKHLLSHSTRSSEQRRMILSRRPLLLRPFGRGRQFALGRFNSFVPPTEQHGKNLIPWLRAMKEIRAIDCEAPQSSTYAPLTPKHMDESFYSITLPFSSDEVERPHPTQDANIICSDCWTSTLTLTNKSVWAS
jgi:hypothetical protein